MKSAHPEAFRLLVLHIPIVLIQLRLYRAARQQLEPLLAITHGDNQAIYLVKLFFRALSFHLVVLCLILALADISWGTRPVHEDRQHLDLIAVVDVSRSMLATDVKPSRLDRTKELLHGLVEQIQNVRVGLVVFKGEALQLVPLTEDIDLFHSFLSVLNGDVITSPGTDVEAGLRLALMAFSNPTARNRIIVLFSDGESLGGDPLNAARMASEAGIPIHTVGMATLQGEILKHSNGEPLRDEQERPVLSRLQVATLNEIANITDSQAIHIGDADVFRSLIYVVREYQRGQEQQGFRLVDVRRYRLLLWLAFAALGLHVGIRIVRWKNVF